MLTTYETLRLKLTHIPPGSKGPEHNNWQIKPTSYNDLENGYSEFNIGLLHGLSKTCCLDIDDLETAQKVPGFDKLINAGIKYKSGKKNRLKVLFRIPKKHNISLFTTHTLRYEGKVFGQFRCVSSNGTSVQDVLPPSLHPDGHKYSWVDELPENFRDIPKLPKAIIERAHHKSRVRQVNNRRYQSEGLSFYVKIYNDYFNKKGYSLEQEIMNTGGYIDLGMGRFRRVGSSNKLALAVYEDDHGQFGVNYSDTVGPEFIKYGAFDPYDMLVMLKFSGNEKAARHYVTSEHSKLKTLCDKEKKIKAELGTHDKIPLLRKKGLLFDKRTDCPYLSTEILLPGSGSDGDLSGADRRSRSKFTRIVESVLFHQEGVYNPDMAFWFSLSFIDHLAGCGYESVNSNRTAPLYVFTAGDSSDGKSSTIQSGEKHLLAIGGRGNAFREEAEISTKKKGSKENTPIIGTDFVNKRHIKNVGSAQGLEDLICSELEHGCDILFTLDEYGLKDNGTMDAPGKAMRSLLLSYRTLSRFEAVEPRYLAQSQGNKAVKRSPTYCVHFNYFTAATNETLKGVIRDSEVGMGYIQRFVGGVARSKYFGARNRVLGEAVTEKPVAASVIKMLKNITKHSNLCTGYKRTEKGYTVRIDEDALEYLQELSNICIESRNVRVKKLVENIQPICRVRAIAENPKRPVVTLEIVKWAHTIASSSILYFDWLLQELAKENVVSVEEVMEQKIIKYMLKIGCTSVGKAITRNRVINGANIHKLGPASIYTPVWHSILEAGILVQAPIVNKKIPYYIDVNGPGVFEYMEEDDV